MPKRSAIAVYAAGFLQGSAFVLMPALGSILAAAPYHLSSSVYGLLYLPQAVGAIIGALGAGFLQKHIGSHGIFRLGVEANLVALILLVGVAHTGATLALTLLLLDSLFLGAGFGLTLATVSTIMPRCCSPAPRRAPSPCSTPSSAAPPHCRR